MYPPKGIRRAIKSEWLRQGDSEEGDSEEGDNEEGDNEEGGF